MTGMLLKSLARPRLLGSARQDGKRVVFTATGVDSSEIEGESAAWVEFAKLRTSADVIDFVSRFGPVSRLPHGTFELQDRLKLKSNWGQPRSFSDNIETVLEEAAYFKSYVELLQHLQRAAKGDQKSREFIRREIKTEFEFSDGETMPTLVLLLNEQLGKDLEARVENASLQVVSIRGTLGRYEIWLVSDSLLDYCYISATQRISMGELIARCEECSAVFPQKDRRQRFCTPRCAGRVRFRKFKQASLSKRKDGAHGKTRKK